MFQSQYFQLTVDVVYLILFSWIITKISFFTNAGLTKKWLILLFLIKVLAGIFYGIFYSKLSLQDADTWRYFSMSKNETNWLLKNPVAFSKDFFSYDYRTSGNLFSGQNSYWNDLKSAGIIKLMAIFNVFTFKNYYADVVFFNFLFFFGPIALLRLICYYYPEKKWLFVLAIFFLPSFLFWCSGAHKDGLIFSALAVSMFYFNKQLQQKKIILKYWFILIICFAALFVLRNFLLFLLLPALFAWFHALRKPSKKRIIFSALYFAGLILFFALPHLSHSFDFPGYIISKQNEFKLLGGNSVINVTELLPSFTGFLKFLPNAFDVAFLRPHLFESGNLSCVFAALENIFLLIIIVFSVIFRNKKTTLFSFNIFLLFFSLSVLLISGYTVTFSGSIVRYKSIVLPFLLLFFLIIVNEKYLPRFLKTSKENLSQ